MEKTDDQNQILNEASLTVARTALPQTHTLSLGERFVSGKALRKECGRKLHAVWAPPSDRVDPIDLLEQDNQGRIEELNSYPFWTHGCQSICLLPWRSFYYGVRSGTDTLN